MNAFHTESSSRKGQHVILYVYLSFALLSLLGLKIALITCLYFEAISLFSALICFVAVSKTRWTIDFYEKTVLLSNTANGKQYCLDDLSAAVFHIKQNAFQKSTDRCDLVLADLPFKLYDVKNCAELKKYILSTY